MSESCVFCDIAEGRAPAFVVAENELAFAFLDIQPLARGHCLVIPRRHVQWWEDMTEAETDAVFRLARLTAAKIRKVFDPGLVTMYVRGRRVPHAHVFLVPTFGGDPLDRTFNVLEGIQEFASELTATRMPEEMRETSEQLRNA